MRRYQFKGGELVTRPHQEPMFIPIWCQSIDTTVSREVAAHQLKLKRAEEQEVARSTLVPGGRTHSHSFSKTGKPARSYSPHFQEPQRFHSC